MRSVFLGYEKMLEREKSAVWLSKESDQENE